MSAPELKLHRVPALSVVLNPSVDTALTYYERLNVAENHYEAKDSNKGFNPGPLENRSLQMDSNTVPMTDYNRKHFGELKGADFRLVNVCILLYFSCFIFR